MRLFTRLGALFLGVLMSLTIAGCANSGAMTVVATVNGVNIYRWEVDRLYNKNKEYYESESGIDLESNEYFEQKQTFRESLLGDLIEDTAVVEKAKKNGYDLTDAEKAAVKKEYDDFVAENIASYEKNYKDDPSAADKAKKDWEKSLKDNNMTADFLYQNMYNSKVHEKLANDLYKDLKTDETELKKAYDGMVEDQKTKYTEHPEEYGTDDAAPNGTVMYVPAGYVRVKQILLEMPKEENDQISALNKEQGNLILEMAKLAQEKGKDDKSVQETNQKLIKLDDEVQAIKDKGLEKIKAKADEVLAKVKAGDDFDKLIDEYGQDPSMQIYPFNQYGYLVCAKSKWIEDFNKASLAIQNVGETSDLVPTVNGYHIIKLLEKCKEGPKPFEGDVRDVIVKLQLAPQQKEILNNYSKQAVSELEVVVYKNRL